MLAWSSCAHLGSQVKDVSSLGEQAGPAWRVAAAGAAAGARGMQGLNAADVGQRERGVRMQWQQRHALWEGLLQLLRSACMHAQRSLAPAPSGQGASATCAGPATSIHHHARGLTATPAYGIK